MFPKREKTLRTSLPAVLAASLLSGLAACGGAPVLSVDHGYVRLAAVPHHPAVAYFTIHGGAADTVLLSVSTDIAVKAELHQSMTAGGMATMTPLDTLPVPARATLAFAPGGRHVMLFDVNPGVKPGRHITLIFAFSNGQKLSEVVPSVAAGDPAPE